MRRTRNGVSTISRRARSLGNYRRGRGPRQGPRPMEPRAMQAERVGGPVDPQQVNLAIKTMYRGELLVGYAPTTAGAYTNVTLAQIAARIPGSPSAVRVVKLSLFGPAASASTTDAPSVSIKMPGDTSFLDGNTMAFEDHGTQGQSRSAVHVVPSFIQRARWYPSTATDVVCSVASDQGSTSTTINMLLQFTVEIQSSLVPVTFQH